MSESPLEQAQEVADARDGRSVQVGWRSIFRRHPLVTYVLRRIAVGIVLAFVVSIVVFLATQALPGDAASVILGREASQEMIAEVREDLNLNDPIHVQYFTWVTDFIRGDLGESFAQNQPVTEILSRRVWNTVVLGGATLLVLAPLAFALGVSSAVRAGRPWDTVVSVVTLGAIAVPEFVVGSVLVAVVAIRMGLLPAVSLIQPGESALADPRLLVLPVATLVITTTGYATRMIRASLVEVLRADYVAMARLHGLSERRVIWRHAVPNSLGPTIQRFALLVQWLVGGVVVIEVIFAYPGLGQTVVNSVASRDIPVIQGAIMYIAAFFIMINILADLAVVFVVPKLRTAP